MKKCDNWREMDDSEITERFLNLEAEIAKLQISIAVLQSEILRLRTGEEIVVDFSSKKQN